MSKKFLHNDKFEAFFRDPKEPWIFWERFNRDGETKVAKISLKNETFIEDINGKFKFLLNENIKLKKVNDTKSITQKKYGSNNAGYCWIRDRYWDLHGSQYNFNPNIWYLDIETTAKGKINTDLCPETVVLIQIYDKSKNTVIVLGLQDFNYSLKDNKYYHKNKIYNFNFKYLKCETESELLKSFFKLIEVLKPLIVLAHNGNNFDYIYLYKRSKYNNLETKFSPWGDTVLDYNMKSKSFELKSAGIFYLDSIDVYKKFILEPRQSYSLDYLAEVELNSHKVNHDYFNTFDGFRTGEGYIMPDSIPENPDELEIYNAYKYNPENISKISYNQFVHYGIIDVEILYNIDKKLQLTDILISLASEFGCQIDEALGTTKPWSQAINNYAYQKNLILPDFERTDESFSIKGGFVGLKRPGKYGWGGNIDIDSAYPLTSMIAHNISPETYIEPQNVPKELRDFVIEHNFFDEDEHKRLEQYFNGTLKKYSELLKKYNLVGTVSGSFYRRDKVGIIPEMVEIDYNQRKVLKNEKLEYKRKAQEVKNFDPEKYDEYSYKSKIKDVKQNTKKVKINANFGAQGNQYFRLFNAENAKSITAQVRFYVNLISINIENYLQSLCKSEIPYCIYTDTDSIYVSLNNYLKNIINQTDNDNTKADKISDFFQKNIQPIVDKTSLELAEIFNCLRSDTIHAKRETVFKNAVWLSKKHYFMSVIDNEFVRYKEPEIKKMGIEIVKSSTPKFVKENLEDSLKIILNQDEKTLKEWLKETKVHFTSQKLEDIAKISSVGSTNYDLENPSYDENNRKIAIPINSRAFLVTNNYLKNNLEFQQLTENEKIKMLYLKMPNPLNSDIFAFNNNKFAETLRDYVDFDLNWEKYFMKPLNSLIEPLNYNLDDKTEDFDW
jgi:DNA polymerase